MYTRTQLKVRIATLVAGDVTDTDQNTLLNRAVSEVFSDVDLKTAKRRTAAVPGLFDDIYAHSCPSDLKGIRIIDVAPQINRGRFDDWRLTTTEEFDRLKKDLRSDKLGDPIKLGRSSWSGDNILAVANHDGVRSILISRPIDNDNSVTVDPLDSATNWTAVGDAETLTADSANYVSEGASLRYNIGSGGGTTAGITNAALTAFDLTVYKTEGSAFVWAYIPSVTYLTNFILRIGNSASNYYQITITTNNEGTAFYNGWNLLRFDFTNKTTTGTVTLTTCNYVSLYMTKNALKISESGYRFDSIQLKLGVPYDVWYYSRYGWQTAAGAWQQNSSDDGDFLNADEEEVSLIEDKYAELAEMHLRDMAKSAERRTLYEQRRGKYQLQNPSEALLLSTTYFQINNF